jgi:Uma2 family endonuclease
MAIAGVFIPETRLELIKGEIIQMSPIDKKHGACVARLNQLLVQNFYWQIYHLGAKFY